MHELSLAPAGIAYAVGAGGVLCDWRAYLLTSDRGFRRWSATGALLWGLMYALLGAWTAALTMAFTAFRTGISGWLSARLTMRPAWQRHLLVAGFLLVFSLLALLSWQGPISLLPWLAACNTTIALFYLEQRRLRLALLISSALWISNDLLWHAWPALVAETISVLLNWRTLRGMTVR